MMLFPTDRQIQSLLDTTPMQRARAGLGGSHTVVTYPPLDSLEALNGSEPFRIEGTQEAHIYFHVAFCEFVCSFCHYHRSQTVETKPAPALRPYLDALAAEIAMRKTSLSATPIASMYIGGGTPTSLPERDLAWLFERIGTLANLEKTRVCVETSPITASGEAGQRKLRLLARLGMDRVSIGVQSFDQELLQAHRGHDLSTLSSALENVFALGVEVNIDLMQDLPLQNDASIEGDLVAVARYVPSQVTWYCLRLHEGSAMNRMYDVAPDQGKFSDLPTPLESARRRRRIIEGMRSLGYIQGPGGRFTRADSECDQYKKVRGGLASNMLGFGASAYSHGWGYFFRNITGKKTMMGTQEYIRRIAQAHTPVAWANPLTPLEFRAASACEQARHFLSASLLDHDDLTGAGWRAVTARCVSAGLFEQYRDGYQLTSLGKLFEEEVASLYYSQPVREALKRKRLYWASDQWFEQESLIRGARSDAAALPARQSQRTGENLDFLH